MGKQQKLTASQENYIKAIYKITKEKKAAKAKDICAMLGIGASSVSEALKNLGERGFINYAPYELITLTDIGDDIAKGLIERQEIIQNFLINILKVIPEAAEENANLLEHAITGDTLDKFVKFFQFSQICPCKEPKWMKGYHRYSEQGLIASNCQECIKNKGKNEYASSNCCSKGCCS